MIHKNFQKKLFRMKEGDCALIKERLMKSVKEGKAECIICFSDGQELQNPTISHCGHIFCGQCANVGFM